MFRCLGIVGSVVIIAVALVAVIDRQTSSRTDATSISER